MWCRYDIIARAARRCISVVHPLVAHEALILILYFVGNSSVPLGVKNKSSRPLPALDERRIRFMRLSIPNVRDMRRCCFSGLAERVTHYQNEHKYNTRNDIRDHEVIHLWSNDRDYVVHCFV
jgi:hypothetical protein